MKTFRNTLMLLVATFILAGCGWDRIPPAHKGKLLTGSGYQDEVLDPGRKFSWAWQHLILLDMSTQTFDAPMTVILSDRLELHFDVKFRARLRNDPQIINAMFNDINIDRKVGLVDLARVYNIYARMIVENVSRSVLSEYSSDEVYQNYGRISSELATALQPRLANTPIELQDVIVGNIRFPAVVTQAIELAKERELDIQRERAQNEIDLLKRENERALAEAEYETRMTRARAIRDENKMIADGISDDLLRWRALEIQEEFARHAGEGNFTFMPIESLSTVGGNMRVYQKE